MPTPSAASPPRARLLIVDDDPAILRQLEMALETEFEVSTADRREEAVRVVEEDRPELITMDLALDGRSTETGFSLLEECLRIEPYAKVVMITGNDTEGNAVRAVTQGAADFLPKPIDVDELLVLLRRLRTVGRLERQSRHRRTTKTSDAGLGELIGSCKAMTFLFDAIRRVAEVNVGVLILGESGTGKELVAREIRRLSARADRPFVSINCGAIPENLLESELFGHEKGSFTGAHARREGRLELANEGIVFLDEVGELSLPLQVKLLRFLQDHEIQRVGGRENIPLDVRVVAATNRKPEKEIEAGRLRDDLFYRLSVVTLTLPPLRDREDDAVLLAEHFVSRYAEEYDRGPLTLTTRARRAIKEYAWPGNVRELQHCVQKAALMSSGRALDAHDLGLGKDGTSVPLSLRNARMETDRRMVTEALHRTSGNVSRAARLLDVSRPSLHELLHKLGVSASEFRARNPEGRR